MQCCVRCLKSLEVEHFGINVKGERLRTCMCCRAKINQRNDNNREELNKKGRDYYQTVKESKSKYVKQYRLDNSEKLCEIQHCECGGKYQKRKIWNHSQTMRHKKYLENLALPPFCETTL